MAYAVIRAGGKQYRVAVGDVIRVERLPVEPGRSINLDEVLLVGDDKDVRVGTPLLTESVSATVRAHGRGDKIRVFKLRRRKNYRRRAGHRQEYTELEVTGIAGVAKAPKKTAKTATHESGRAEEKTDETKSD